MSKPFDPTLPVRTRDGRAARIICTDCAFRDQPYIALVEMPNNGPDSWCGYFYRDGRMTAHRDSDNDLINVEPRVEEWLNVYVTKLSEFWCKDGDYMRMISTSPRRTTTEPCVVRLKRIREGSRVISCEVVEFAKEATDARA